MLVLCFTIGSVYKKMLYGKNGFSLAGDYFLPTYNIGAPEKNPIFLEKRVYQGSSGTVYPHAVVEKIEDEKKDNQKFQFQ